MAKKIFVSHGDIILDKIYNGDLEFIKQDGGGCNWNDLYNLSLMGETCYAFGTAGNDEEGKVAISSLKRANVDTSYIEIEEKSTNIMNIIIPNSNLNDNTVIHSWYSPITNKFTMNFSENLPKKLPDSLQNNEVYLILDKFLPVNLEFLESIQNRKVCLDIGHIRFFEHFTRQYLLNFFKNADYVQLNNSVTDLLFERLDVKDEAELFELLDLKLLVLTKGKKGAIFFFRDNNYNIVSILKKPEIVVNATDTSGAGDAFFSMVVREFAYADKIDEFFVEAELFELLDLKLLVLTKGKKGAIFFFRDNNYNIVSILKKPEIVVNATDTSGAGDAFFSMVVREFAYADKIDEFFVDNTFSLANAASRDVLANLGSRKTT